MFVARPALDGIDPWSSLWLIVVHEIIERTQDLVKALCVSANVSREQLQTGCKRTFI